MHIRVVIDGGSRKMHLFDFIRAMTGCLLENAGNEWKHIQSNLEKEININILISQKVRFTEIHSAKLTRSDSMVIDIYGAAKVALSIGKRANWFNEILTNLGNSSSVGDLKMCIRDRVRCLWSTV